ncbi:MAG: hypothetical protein R3E10_07055 [Gemmatimonadota bacterium]
MLAQEATAASTFVSAFLDARSEAERERAARAILDAGTPFGEVLPLLRSGRVYGSDVPTGRVRGVRSDAEGVELPYFAQVPEGYTAERRWPVRVYLHGGVMRERPSQDELWWRDADRLASEDHIAVFPAAWRTRRWWQNAQMENLREILRILRRTYNIDENRISLSGVSDGGTGAWWMAFRDTTPWASFLPFIGHPVVLLNPAVGAEGEVFPSNLVNKPLYVVNGEEDRLYPASSVDPFIVEFANAGAQIEYRPKRGYGHETGWWPEEVPRIDAFVAAFPREPHPRCISWETESPQHSGRAHWLRIDALGDQPSDVEFPASALVPPSTTSGRADLSREGNLIRIRSRGVRALTLLLSPDAFDLAQPVRVRWNGIDVHEGHVAADVGTLLRWAARDDDRTMLYAAELHLDAPRGAARWRPGELDQPLCGG